MECIFFFFFFFFVFLLFCFSLFGGFSITYVTMMVSIQPIQVLPFFFFFFFVLVLFLFSPLANCLERKM